MVITVDGPAGAGKSTVAKLLAKKLDVAFMDTGAMYRALTLKAMRHQVKLDDENALVFISLVKLIVVRDRFPAWTAPGSPKVNHHDFTCPCLPGNSAIHPVVLFQNRGWLFKHRLMGFPILLFHMSLFS